MESPIPTNIKDLNEAAKKRSSSEWHRQMMSEMEAFENSEYEDLNALNIGTQEGDLLHLANKADAEATASPDTEVTRKEKWRTRIRKIGRRALASLHELLPAKYEYIDYEDENREMLAGAGELGEILLPYYEIALQKAPSLSIVKINRDDQGSPESAHDFVGGRHRIRMPLGPDTPQRLQNLVSSRPETLEYIAHTLGMAPEELSRNSRVLAAHAMLHELGHTLLYMKYENNPKAYEERRVEELSQLPIPNNNGVSLSISELEKSLSDNSSELSQWLRNNWESLKAKYNISTKEELIAIQSIARRKLFHEYFADQFAARVINRARQAGSNPVEATRIAA